MSSSFGRLLALTTYGESHGPAIGGVLDGFPSGVEIDLEQVQAQLDRRKPGQSNLTTQRKESDTVQLLSGMNGNVTTGTPIGLLINNEDARPRDYTKMGEGYRPSHAEFTYDAKYGQRAMTGGGRASARETAVRVAAGAFAEQLLMQWHGVEIVAWVSRVGLCDSAFVDVATVSRIQVDSYAVRCPNSDLAQKYEEAIISARNEGDTLGGLVTCVCRNVPAGWGEPLFAKLEALLAQAMLSLPATKGFEIGSGFAGTTLRGSEHNDLFTQDGTGAIKTETNNSGGVQGGISNGMPIVFTTAFKPVATIAKEQPTLTPDGEETTISGRGRHDPCVVPRAVPIVEAMAALVLADLMLQQRARSTR